MDYRSFIFLHFLRQCTAVHAIISCLVSISFLSFSFHFLDAILLWGCRYMERESKGWRIRQKKRNYMNCRACTQIIKPGNYRLASGLYCTCRHYRTYIFTGLFIFVVKCVLGPFACRAGTSLWLQYTVK